MSTPAVDSPASAPRKRMISPSSVTTSSMRRGSLNEYALERGKRKRCVGWVLFPLGLFLLVCGLVSFFVIIEVMATTIEDGLIPTQDDQKDNNDKWRRFVYGGKDDEERMERSQRYFVYFWNVTNPREIIEEGAKPMFNEVGPFATVLWSEKYNITFQQGEDLVRFSDFTLRKPLSSASCTEHMRRLGVSNVVCPDPDTTRVTVFNLQFYGLMNALNRQMPETATMASAASQAFAGLRSSLTESLPLTGKTISLDTALTKLVAGQRRLRVPSTLGEVLPSLGVTYGGEAQAFAAFASADAPNCGSYNTHGSSCRWGVNNPVLDSSLGGCNITTDVAQKVLNQSESISVFNTGSNQGAQLWLGAYDAVKTPATASDSSKTALSGLIGLMASISTTPCTGFNASVSAEQRVRRLVLYFGDTWADTALLHDRFLTAWVSTTSIDCTGQGVSCSLEVGPTIASEASARNQSATLTVPAARALALPAPLGSSNFSMFTDDGIAAWVGVDTYCKLNSEVASGCTYLTGSVTRANAERAFNGTVGLLSLHGYSTATATVVACGLANWVQDRWIRNNTFYDTQVAADLTRALGMTITADSLGTIGYVQWASAGVTKALLNAPSLADVSNSGVSAPVELSAVAAAMLAQLGLGTATPVYLSTDDARSLLIGLSGGNASTILATTMAIAMTNSDGKYVDLNPSARFTRSANPLAANLSPFEAMLDTRIADHTDAPRYGHVVATLAQGLTTSAVFKGQRFFCLDPDNCDYRRGGLFTTQTATNYMYEKYTDPFAFASIAALTKSTIERNSPGVTGGFKCAPGLDKKLFDGCPVAGASNGVVDYDCTDEGFTFVLSAGSQAKTYTRTSSGETRKNYYRGTFTADTTPAVPSLTNPSFALFSGSTYDDVAWLKERSCGSVGTLYQACFQEIYTGASSLDDMWDINMYNGNTTIYAFNGVEPIRVKGTDGGRFNPPGLRNVLYKWPNREVKMADKVTAFVSDGVRPLDLSFNSYSNIDYNGDDFKLYTNRFSVEKVDWENAVQTNAGGADAGNPIGLANVEPISGRPLFLGGPAFWFNRKFGGTEWQKYGGMDSTNELLYETYADVDPITGVAMRAAQRIQLHYRIRRSTMFPKLGRNANPAADEYFFPLFWAQKSGVIEADDAKNYESAVYGTQAAAFILLIVLVIVGGLLAIVGAVLAFQGSRSIREHYYAASPTGSGSGPASPTQTELVGRKVV